MPLKILPNRRCSFSDSSDSSPEPEPQERQNKWTLFRAPLRIEKRSPLKPATTPSQKELNIPPTSTPCFRAAPPFQLSQTLLSPVLNYRRQTNINVEVPKPGENAAAKEHSFDNLLSSQCAPDISSYLVVNKREKPLQRRNNDADVERTRQYAGGRIRSKSQSTENIEESGLTVVPPVEELQEKTPDQRSLVRVTTAISKREFAGGKVLTNDSNKVPRPTGIGLQGRRNLDVHNSVLLESAEEKARQRTLSSSPSETNDKKLSLRSTAETEDLIPSEDEETFRCEDASPLKSHRGEEGERERSRVTSEAPYIVSVVSLKEKRNSPRRSEIEKENLNESLREVRKRSLRLSKVQERSFIVSAQQSLSGSPRHAEIKNQSINASCVRVSSPRRKSSILPKANQNPTRGNSLKQNCDRVEANARFSENKDTSQQNWKSDDEQTGRKDQNAERRNGKILIPVLTKMSKLRKSVVQTVSGVEGFGPTKIKEANGGFFSDKPITLKETPRSESSKKKKLDDDVVDVLERQKSLLENDSLTECSMYFESGGLKPVKHDSQSSANEKAFPKVDGFQVNKSTKDSEKYRATILSSKMRDGNADGLAHKGDGNAELAAESRGRKKSEDTDNTNCSKNSAADSTASCRRKGREVADNFGHREDEKAESKTAQRRTGRTSAGNSVRGVDPTSESKTGQSRRETWCADNVGHTENGKAESKTAQRRTGRTSTGNSMRCVDVTGESKGGQNRKKSGGADNFGQKENGVAGCRGGHDDEKIEKSEENDKINPLCSTGSTKITTGTRARTIKLAKPLAVGNERDLLSVADRWPKRERRRPGNYWVAAPDLTPPRKTAKLDINDKGMVERRTRDVSSKNKIKLNQRKKSGDFKKIRGKRSQSTSDKVEEPHIAPDQFKRRRLLFKRELRKSTYSKPPYRTCGRVSESQQSAHLSSRSPKQSISDGPSSEALICHAANIKFDNKNSGMSSENSKIRIGSTISWKSTNGSLIELDPEAVFGPQVDVQNDQVFIFMEGTIVFRCEGQESSLIAGDSALLPAGRKFTILNNSTSMARFYVLRFVDII